MTWGEANCGLLSGLTSQASALSKCPLGCVKRKRRSCENSSKLWEMWNFDWDAIVVMWSDQANGRGGRITGSSLAPTAYPVQTSGNSFPELPGIGNSCGRSLRLPAR
jgi:hypothetical protein